MAKRTTPRSTDAPPAVPPANAAPEPRARSRAPRKNPTATAAERQTLGGAAAGQAEAFDQPRDVPSPQADATRSSGGNEPSADEIRRRAYEMYLDRGRNDGNHFEDWLQAERELKQQ